MDRVPDLPNQGVDRRNGNGVPSPSVNQNERLLAAGHTDIRWFDAVCSVDQVRIELNSLGVLSTGQFQKLSHREPHNPMDQPERFRCDNPRLIRELLLRVHFQG